MVVLLMILIFIAGVLSIGVIILFYFMRYENKINEFTNKWWDKLEAKAKPNKE